MTEDVKGSIPPKHAVLAALQRISASPEFDKADRLKAFLDFVITEQLAGRADAIKEYLIGFEVYHKPDFDPRMDASVRVGAGKLRTRLEHYYAGTGREDPVVISIPKGTYVPHVYDRIIPSSAVASPAPPRRIYGRVAFAIALVAVLLCAGIVSWPSKTPQSGQRRRIQITVDPGVESHPSFSPDGTQIAFSADIAEPENFDIYIKDINSGRMFRLTSDPGRDSNPAWSPDGKTIGFNRNEGYGGQVLLVAATGGVEKKLAHVNLGGLAWTADSRYLAARHRGSQAERPHQVLIEVDTGQTKPLTTSMTFEDYHAAFSPDGKWVALVRCHSGFACEVHLGALVADGKVIEPTRKLVNSRGAVHGVAWTGDSSSILYSAGLYNDWGLWRISINPGSPKPERLKTGDLSVHFPTTPFRGPRSVNAVAFETQTLDENMWIASLPGPSSSSVASPRTLASTPRGEWAPALSPDGRRLAFVSDRSGCQQLWVAAPDGTAALQITDLPGGAVVYPRWSPDGTEIVFSYISQGEAGTSREIVTVRTNPGSPLVRITALGKHAKDPAWSVDGKWIYHARRDGQTQLWRSSRDGRVHQQLTRFGGERPLVSHDRVYYVSTGDGLWSADLDGKNERKVLPEAHDAAWHTVRDGIIFVPRPSHPLAGNLAHWNAATGEIRSLGPLPHPDLATFTVNLQETAILYSRQDRKTINIAIIDNYDEPLKR